MEGTTDVRAFLPEGARENGKIRSSKTADRTWKNSHKKRTMQAGSKLEQGRQADKASNPPSSPRRPICRASRSINVSHQ